MRLRFIGAALLALTSVAACEPAYADGVETKDECVSPDAYLAKIGTDNPNLPYHWQYVRTEKDQAKVHDLLARLSEIAQKQITGSWVAVVGAEDFPNGRVVVFDKSDCEVGSGLLSLPTVEVLFNGSPA